MTVSPATLADACYEIVHRSAHLMRTSRFGVSGLQHIGIYAEIRRCLGSSRRKLDASIARCLQTSGRTVRIQRDDAGGAFCLPRWPMVSLHKIYSPLVQQKEKRRPRVRGRHWTRSLGRDVTK